MISQPVLALFISAVALIFTFLSHQRNRLFDNANHLFKLKTDLYPKILKELNLLINSMNDHLNDVREWLKEEDEDAEAKIEDAAEKVDAECFKFTDFLIENSIIIPDSISKPLEEFCDKILEDDKIYSSDISNNHLLLAQKFLDEIIRDAENIQSLMKKDLAIKKLNASLQKRLSP